jgi:hypothetical protein
LNELKHIINVSSIVWNFDGDKKLRVLYSFWYHPRCFHPEIIVQNKFEPYAVEHKLKRGNEKT